MLRKKILEKCNSVLEEYKKNPNDMNIGFKKDQEAICNDFLILGEDLRRTMKKYEEEKTKLKHK